MNRSVSAAQVGGFQLKIKTIQTGSYLYTFNMTNPMSYTINDQESYVTFQVQDTDNKLKPGQFYKAQLAYISVSEAAKQQALYAFSLGDITLEEYEKIILEDKDSIIGFFSTAGTFKYTIKPNLFINNFSSDKLNSYTHSFTGYYDQTEGDISERVYSYRFDIYNAKNNLVYTSGDCVHNSLNDDTQTFGLSYDTFKLFADLEYNAIYTVQYTITTINNLTLSTPKYRMSQRETVDPEIHAEIQATLNFEDGYILVELSI